MSTSADAFWHLILLLWTLCGVVSVGVGWGVVVVAEVRVKTENSLVPVDTACNFRPLSHGSILLASEALLVDSLLLTVVSVGSHQ